MRKTLSLFFLLLLGFPSLAEAEESCNEAHLVVDQELLWDFRASPLQVIPLPTHRQGVLTPTRGLALVQGQAASSSVLLSFGFPTAPGEEVGLAYNVYEIALRFGATTDADMQLIHLDFTNGCTQVGPSMFPGGQIELPPFYVNPHNNGEARGLEPLHLRIWGWR